jgi:UDP-N-acetylglucosamine--N-acetylmuramyl-(pentapeptide) pyrophosphoryl-undecaprenol N-acetylglucosamine transferase
MTRAPATTPFIAVACGGTGGHLFPGMAVAEQLVRRGGAVTLLISPKDVDQQAVKSASGLKIITLPAVALQRGNWPAFCRGFWQSWRAAQKLFKGRPPQAALAMGGFTSAPPILAAKCAGAKTFLHESNTIPGRANRWLARFVNQAFVGFPSAAPRLHARQVTVTGTPVRAEFQPRDPAASRAALGLDPARPVLLVMGGSQGASDLNDVVLAALPLLARRLPDLQWLHLTGPNDFDRAKQVYATLNLKAVVHPFLAGMDSALGSATVAVTRAGASSLAELAAMRVPSVLVPFPFAAGGHQLCNARAFEQTGAARLLEQRDATPGKLAALVSELVTDAAVRQRMQSALARWHAPKAAEEIAEIILQAVTQPQPREMQNGRLLERRTPIRRDERTRRCAAPNRSSALRSSGSLEAGRIA